MTSFFELFKIGIGPSSSHTVGPMIAARRFMVKIREAGKLDAVCRLRIDLFGSLAHTGKGHGTDRALILGLCGAEPESIDPAEANRLLALVREKRVLELLGEYPLTFSLIEDIRFRCEDPSGFHPNAMTFTAFDLDREVIRAENFYSIGGGFVVGEGESNKANDIMLVPYPFHTAAELLNLCANLHLAIWELVLRNESVLRPESEVRSGVDRIWRTMHTSIERGMAANGLLPGKLKVRRRAKAMAAQLAAKRITDPLAPLDWVSVFAIAVNEENAAGGRVVTAPTNGAAGIVPAVAKYYFDFVPNANQNGLLRYFLTAAAIGILYKENASISGAEVGCQGEVGVAASMAAGGLAAAFGGSNKQIEHAAEIAMEHHLGMTCDPIGGLVQIPCIERNAMGAVKAINACRMAMNDSDDHKVSLDQVIETMYRTGLDMQSRYKETSLAGLALNIIEC
jgi:L-serine dehydratase